MCPWLSLCTVTFKKLTSVLLPSEINLMFLWKECKASKQELNSSSVLGQIMYMSSIYLHRFRGCNLDMAKNFISSVPIVITRTHSMAHHRKSPRSQRNLMVIDPLTPSQGHQFYHRLKLFSVSWSTAHPL